MIKGFCEKICFRSDLQFFPIVKHVSWNYRSISQNYEHKTVKHFVKTPQIPWKWNTALRTMFFLQNWVSPPHTNPYEYLREIKWNSVINLKTYHQKLLIYCMLSFFSFCNKTLQPIFFNLFCSKKGLNFMAHTKTVAIL